MAGFQDSFFVYERTWQMLPHFGSLEVCRLFGVIQDTISCLEMFLCFPPQTPFLILGVISWISMILQKLEKCIIVLHSLIKQAEVQVKLKMSRRSSNDPGGKIEDVQWKF